MSDPDHIDNPPVSSGSEDTNPKGPDHPDNRRVPPFEPVTQPLPEPTRSRTVLFADGDHGSAVQVHQLLLSDETPLDIVYVWSRDSYDDSGQRRFYYAGEEYPNGVMAVRAWQAAGCPVHEDAIDAAMYLSPSKIPQATPVEAPTDDSDKD